LGPRDLDIAAQWREKLAGFVVQPET